MTATAAMLGVAVDALMEPTGTYGDALRELLFARGAHVHMLGAKRVHDAREVFDGVTSLHDAKSCVVIAQLHRQGVSRPYVAAREDQVRLRALVHRREIHETPLQMLLGDLESRLARHWPELLVDMDVWRRKNRQASGRCVAAPATRVVTRAERSRFRCHARTGGRTPGRPKHAVPRPALRGTRVARLGLPCAHER